jgi:hypothetical protein
VLEVSIDNSTLIAEAITGAAVQAVFGVNQSFVDESVETVNINIIGESKVELKGDKTNVYFVMDSDKAYFNISITGGKYNFDPKAYVPEDYSISEVEGIYEVFK